MTRKLDTLAKRAGTSRTSKQEIVESALKCFEKFGPHRTSMTDIAEEAGISRKTLYRIFEDRPALIEHILNLRLIKMGSKIRKKIESYEDLQEALIEGSIVSIAVAREDKIFNEILQKDTNHSVEQFLFQSNEQTRFEVTDIWSPVIDRGRAKGLVREDIPNVRLVEFISSVQALLLMRDDYDEIEQRTFLSDLLVPAIMRSGDKAFPRQLDIPPIKKDTDQSGELKRLQKENERLRKAVSDLTLDKLILAEVPSENE